MGTYLYTIFPCIGMGGTEKGEKDLINYDIRIYYRTVMKRISRGID